jgi:hypothetical protein
MERAMKDEEGATLEALQRRIVRLEDERAILDTLHRYGQMIDYRLDRAWADLFTPDGEFLCVDHTGKEIIRERGREALAKWARDFAGGETRLMKHCVIAPVITVDGNTAKVESYFSNLVENEDRYGAPHIRFMGRYSDEMARGEDGKWRFRQRVSTSEAPLVD